MSTTEPSATELASQLGTSRAAWDRLQAIVAGLPGVTPAWKFYGAKHGWQLKLLAGARALAYAIPKDGYFVVAAAVRAPAIQALRAAGYPEERVREIESSREAPEGKPARVEVRSLRDLGFVETLFAAKHGATATPATTKTTTRTRLKARTRTTRGPRRRSRRPWSTPRWASCRSR